MSTTVSSSNFQRGVSSLYETSTLLRDQVRTTRIANLIARYSTTGHVLPNQTERRPRLKKGRACPTIQCSALIIPELLMYDIPGNKKQVYLKQSKMSGDGQESFCFP